MGKNIEFTVRRNEGARKGYLTSLPDECPFCRKHIVPIILTDTYISFNDQGRVLFWCPNTKCNEPFIGYYSGSNNDDFTLERTSIGKEKTVDFGEDLREVSPSFEAIYNEAYTAEQFGLTQICGAGYRKALEFLIKDYAKQNKPPADQSKIDNMLLGPVIAKYINDLRIQNVAERAAWLGNDETHYIRKWVNKDLASLKDTINLVVYFILSEIGHRKVTESMPKGKKS